MANTSSRTLRLLSLLQHHRFWPGQDLAEKLEVSLRTLRRDVDRLRELGYPVQATRGSTGGYQLAAGASLPPLVVDDEEAVALAIGLRLAAQGSVTGIEEASISALAKVIQVMPGKLRRRVEALRAVTVPATTNGPLVDAELLTTVAQSCRDQERLSFSYTAQQGGHSERLVEPHRLVSLGQRWYLVAYDLDRHDWRSFRLDRLRLPHNTGVRFRPRELPAKDAASYLQNSLNSLASGPQQYRLLMHAPLESVREKLGDWAQLSERSEASCELRISAYSADWAAFAVLSSGADFELIDAPGLAELLDDWTERIKNSTTPGTNDARQGDSVGTVAL
ncbi:putative DNA-binding transcriptional regulator YafY [Psychromicrobium silvestre]|uniref:Putative DNA-binding transcriptional regulator YafY n=1 Tax=Psychromicrobium silvestre TaxID=1645614 RepID=A0A7Y9LUZ4_9MICC|nr:YafY family protein [Psychromicrobium silvestre]NYE96103.1 putative DNA-binding transcriptional regulator YafY [Psychromicrobium silvestre]